MVYGSQLTKEKFLIRTECRRRKSTQEQEGKERVSAVHLARKVPGYDSEDGALGASSGRTCFIAMSFAARHR